MVRGDDETAVVALRLLRISGASRRFAEECALMLMLYGGFPAALEGLRALNAAWPGRARRTREGGPARWRARGTVLCRRVYGGAFERLLPAVRALHPDLAVWMVEHGYGRVLSRPGVGVRDRELVTIAALAALGWERQLVSHVLGAARVGATPQAVGEAVSLGAEAADARGRSVARRTWDRLRRLGLDSPPRAGRMITSRSS